MYLQRFLIFIFLFDILVVHSNINCKNTNCIFHKIVGFLVYLALVISILSIKYEINQVGIDTHLFLFHIVYTFILYPGFSLFFLVILLLLILRHFLNQENSLYHYNPYFNYLILLMPDLIYLSLASFFIF